MLSRDDIRFISDTYGTLSVYEMAAALDKSVDEIRDHVKGTKPQKKKVFREEEGQLNNYLKQMFPVSAAENKVAPAEVREHKKSKRKSRADRIAEREAKKVITTPAEDDIAQVAVLGRALNKPWIADQAKFNKYLSQRGRE